MDLLKYIQFVFEYGPWVNVPLIITEESAFSIYLYSHFKNGVAFQTRTPL